LSNVFRPPHPPLSPDYGGEDKGEGVYRDANVCSIIYAKVNNPVVALNLMFVIIKPLPMGWRTLTQCHSPDHSKGDF